MKPIRTLALVALLALVPAALLGCSDETKDKVKSAADSAKQDAQDAVDKAKESATSALQEAKDKATSAVDEAGAKGAAQYVQGRVKAAKPQQPRDANQLEGFVDDLPSQVEVSGLDTVEQDGKLQFTVGDTSSCLTIPETGTDTQVADGAC